MRSRPAARRSCSSPARASIYDAAYDAGRFAAVNNARDTVVKGIAKWDEKLAVLVDKRVGDNYDLSGYDDFVGVVCTPFRALRR